MSTQNHSARTWVKRQMGQPGVTVSWKGHAAVFVEQFLWIA